MRNILFKAKLKNMDISFSSDNVTDDAFTLVGVWGVDGWWVVCGGVLMKSCIFVCLCVYVVSLMLMKGLSCEKKNHFLAIHLVATC